MVWTRLQTAPGWSTMSPFFPQLLQALRNVHFKTPDGSEIIFDANGDLVTHFDIFQGQKTTEGVFHSVHVGMIDPQVSSGNKMMVHLKEEIQVSCLNAEMTPVLVVEVTGKFQVQGNSLLLCTKLMRL